MKLEVIQSVDKLTGILKALAPSSVPVAIDIETTGVSPYRDKTVGVGIAWSEEEGCYVPISHFYNQQVDGKQALALISSFLETHPWLAFNVPFEFEFLRQDAGLSEKALDSVMDTQIMAYCSGLYEIVSLKAVCEHEKWDTKPESYREFMARVGLHPNKNTIAEAAIEVVAPYCVGDAVACFKVYKTYYPMVKDSNL